MVLFFRIMPILTPVEIYLLATQRMNHLYFFAVLIVVSQLF